MIKFTSCSTHCHEQLEADDGNIYERHGKDNWRIWLGESTEPEYFREVELEAAYWEFKNKEKEESL